MLGLQAILRVAAVPVWGWGADRLGRGHAALALAAGLAATAAALLPLAPLTWPLFVLACCKGAITAALTPLVDAVAIPLASAGRLEYGRSRAWGSIAYMLATAAAGALIGATSTMLVPALLTVGYALAAIFSLRMPKAEPASAGHANTASPFRMPEFRLALVASGLIQGSHAAYYSFAALRWRAAGIAPGVVGLLIAEGIVAEIILFLWGRRLVERIGPGRLTILASAISIVRWLLLAAIVNPVWLAAIQVMHAGTFAFQHLSAMLVMRRVAPGRAATAQTWLAALGISLPAGMMVWIAGLLYARNPALPFVAMAGVAALALPVGVRLRAVFHDHGPAILDGTDTLSLSSPPDHERHARRVR